MAKSIKFSFLCNWFSYSCVEQASYNQHLAHGIRSGRKFYFKQPNERLHYLADFAELRKGLFHSVVIAENGKQYRPLLNVDVSHKAFPKPYRNLIDLVLDMEKEYSTQRRRFEVDVKKPLNQAICDKLNAHLAGLELCYCSDRVNRRMYKYCELGQEPARESFTVQVDGRPVRKTVQAYFAELQRPIRYPNVQCIRLGPRNNTISVPMEYCAILGNQVSVLINLIGESIVDENLEKNCIIFFGLVHFRLSTKNVLTNKRQQ